VGVVPRRKSVRPARAGLRRGGKQALFAELQKYLAPGAEAASYAWPAQRLKMNEGAVRMAVHRLRRRYGELFREEVAHTVADPNEIEEEMRHLLRVLSD
jgi:hypothetical protein